MSDDRFAEILNELQARGDKTQYQTVTRLPIFTWYAFCATIQKIEFREAVLRRQPQPHAAFYVGSKTTVRIRLRETRRYALAKRLITRITRSYRPVTQGVCVA